jgi:hypothetical protein
VLSKNRISQSGAKQLVEQTRGMDVEQVELMNNPIRDADHILKHAQSRTSSDFIIGPLWNKDIATGALSSKKTWSDYFFGPAQLMRARILKSRTHPSCATVHHGHAHTVRAALCARCALCALRSALCALCLCPVLCPLRSVLCACALFLARCAPRSFACCLLLVAG